MKRNEIVGCIRSRGQIIAWLRRDGVLPGGVILLTAMSVKQPPDASRSPRDVADVSAMPALPAQEGGKTNTGGENDNGCL